MAEREHHAPWATEASPSDSMPLQQSNNALQLTSGGFMRASRASFMRRLQLNAVFCGRTWCDGGAR
jgi:hypothetical protein